MATRESNQQIGNLTVKVTSEIYDGEIGDTRIDINGENLCWVSGQEKDKFLKEFEELVTKYRI